MAYELEINVNGISFFQVFSKSWKVSSSPRSEHHYSQWEETNEPQAIINALYDFYQTLFIKKLSLSEESKQSFLDKVPLPKLNVK